MRNYYAILGLPRSATQQEIKDAHHFFVKAFHPDKFAGSSGVERAQAEERTKAVNEAYQTLSNPVSRAEYDRQLAGAASSAKAASAGSATTC